MLEDMGKTGGIGWRRAKGNGIEVFPVVTVKMQAFGARPDMFHFIGRNADFGDLFNPPDDKAVPRFSL